MLPRVEESDPARLYGAASGMPGAQQLVKCSNCGMIFESPRYDAQTIVNGYMASQESGHDSQYRMRVHSFYRTLKKHARYLPAPGAKALDIGTAGGAFLDAANQYGYDAYGMEPSADLVTRGKARGLQIEQGTIEEHRFARGSFDLVCLWDVIEHLPDPKSALCEILKLLKPEGILLINFPDIGTWQARLAGRRFWWILSVHLHHFTRQYLAEICSRTGFEAFHFQRYWQTLEFGYLERMAVHYKIPLAALITRFTPGFIQKIPVPYYASQTTALARVKK
jgi:2-polyprenyl-3-methyl-5-hydroxy-6-metoxy-1,4-benzoquinol methylase